MTRIAVVDHGAGNLVSIAQGLRRAGAEVTIATSSAEVEGADGVVLPGVGSTGAVMEGIDRHGFHDVLTSLAVPLLGICVGMQVLFERSEEDGARCLGLLPGSVRRLRQAPRLPHIGWNDLSVVVDEPLLADLRPDDTVYFVHSYAPVPADRDLVTATTRYGSEIVAAVRRETIAGVQFHPERSGLSGLRILDRFVESCEGAWRAA